MIESKSQKLRRNHTQRLPKSKSQERNLKVALQLQGSRQVAEHDNTKIVKKINTYLTERQNTCHNTIRPESVDPRRIKRHTIPPQPRFKSQYF